MINTPPILVDICWTLYRSNTTFDFLDAIISKKSYRLLRAFFKTKVGYRGNILLYRLTHIDWQRRLAIRYLKGMSKAALAAEANSFIAKLEQTKRRGTWVDGVSRQQAPIIILSGTIDCIATAVGHRLHAQKICSSTLEYHNGICTGKLKEDILLNKKKYIGIDHFAILTDNTTDVDIVKQAEKAFIVCYSNKDWWEKQHLQHAEYHYEDDQRY